MLRAQGSPSANSVQAERLAPDRMTYSAPPESVANNPPNEFPDEAGLARRADSIVAESLTKFPDQRHPDRHKLNALLQSQAVKDSTNGEYSHYDGSPVVVIAFEGTGAFEPRRAPAMQALGRQLQSEGFDTKGADYNPTDLVDEALEKKKGSDSNWSGLSHGPLYEVAADPKLNQNVQWLSFPSEETELLKDIDVLKNLDPGQLYRDVKLSRQGSSQGIESALEKIRNISLEAKKQGKNPRFVVMAHSSGGRSAVKFLDELSQRTNPVDGKPYSIPLVATIDPVREAHEALVEGARELVNKSTEYKRNELLERVGLKGPKVYPPVVGSRAQPKTLYATSNVGEWLNFYQREDLQGLQVEPYVGLHGSPVAGAQNEEITGLGDKGHGGICYNPQVNEPIKKRLLQLVTESQP